MSAWALHLGWSVVLAWCSMALVGRWMRNRTVTLGMALAAAVWAWVPGPFGPVHWLGMAFQAPSWVSVQLCAFLLWQLWDAMAEKSSVAGSAHAAKTAHATHAALLGLAVLLGWLLLLDTFAVLPVALYAAGNSPVVITVVAALACLPWVLGGAFSWKDPRPFMGLVAVLLSLVTGSPTGNVWDAVLDPGLWLALHWTVIRVLRNRYKNRS